MRQLWPVVLLYIGLDVDHWSAIQRIKSADLQPVSGDLDDVDQAEGNWIWP